MRRDDDQTYEEYVFEREQDRARGYWRPATAAELREVAIDKAIGVLVFVVFLVVVLVVGAR